MLFSCPRVYSSQLPVQRCTALLGGDITTLASQLDTGHWAGQCTAVSRGAGSSAVDCLQQWNHHQTLPCRPVTAGVMCAGDCCMMALARPVRFLVTEATPSLLSAHRAAEFIVCESVVTDQRVPAVVDV